MFAATVFQKRVLELVASVIQRVCIITHNRTLLTGGADSIPLDFVRSVMGVSNIRRGNFYNSEAHIIIPET